MKIGVPKEIKPQENRVGATPSTVALLVQAGHDVFGGQRLIGHAAPGAQGVLPGPAAISSVACRHRLEVSGHVRAPQPHGG